ncbi:hypothetical protein ACSBR1_030051 [Camellia fascicularis]
MKRFSIPETLGAMIYPPQEKKKNRKNNFAYSTEFQAMLDGLDEEYEECTEESSQSSERKRRLSRNQVKALEKIFEVDNRVEPEQKVKIAEELGLEPRQVAIWFQNRRARWKTKQLERDYGLLKSNYEALKVDYHKLEKEKEGLIAELKGLRAKLGEENTDSNHSVKEDALFLEPDNNVLEQSKASLTAICGKPEQTNLGNNGNLLEIKGYLGIKHGLSDNNHSGVFNEDSNLNAQLLSSMNSSLMNCFQFLDSRAVAEKGYSHQFVKMEEQSLFGTEDSANLSQLIKHLPCNGTFEA